MKSLSTALLILLAASNIDAFHPQWPLTFQSLPRGKKHGVLLDTKDTDSKVPHPPESSPPDKLLGEELFFAVPCDPALDDECEVNRMGFINGSPNEYLSKVVDMERMEKASEFAGQFVGGLADTLFSKEVQPGVPREAIKGAAITGAVLTFLASKGIVVSSAAGLGAAYLAISQGPLGDMLRTMGGVTWEITEAASSLYQQSNASEKLVTLSEKLVDAIADSKKAMQASNEIGIELEETSSELTESQVAFIESQRELERVLKEAEAAIDAADSAIQMGNQTTLESDVPDEPSMEELEAQAALLEKAALIAIDEARQAEVAVLGEARLGEVGGSQEASVGNDSKERGVHRKKDKIRSSQGLEATSLGDQPGLKQVAGGAEQVNDPCLKEGSPFEDNILEPPLPEAEDKELFPDYQDEWVDTMRLAQRGVPGGRVGIGEPLTDQNEKADWAAAVQLAQELEQAPGETIFEDDEEYFDEEAEDDSYDEDDESSDYDLNALAETEGDLEEIARAARAAVEMMQEGGPREGEPKTVDVVPVSKDWGTLTVAELKSELKTRGLKTSGKKADLVFALQQYESELSEAGDNNYGDGADYGIETENLNDLRREARGGVRMYQGDKDSDLAELGRQYEGEEPSDEVLLLLENEQSIIFDDDLGGDEDGLRRVDYTAMTVPKLRAELRRLGLRVGGKKAELIERLESTQDTEK